MSSPESRQPQDFSVESEFSQLIFQGIFRTERQERKLIFDSLRKQIHRVESLGTDDSTRQSFHRTYIRDGGERSVLFYAANFRRVGRTFRAIVNDYSSTPSEGRRIEVKDYLVANSANLITRTTSVVEAAKDQKTIIMRGSFGPLLYKRSDRVEIYSGSEYSLLLPEHSHFQNYSDVLNRREHASELTEVLGSLNEATLEEGFLLAE